MPPKQYTLKLSMVSMLASLSAATRIFLTFLPNVSLTTPITILSGVFLGPINGFLVGFLAMIISDIYIGFGPWSLVTSFTMGLVGVLAGILISRVEDRVLVFALSYLATLLYDVLTSVLTMSVMLNTPVYVALLNLFLPVFIGFIPYPMGPIHELSTAIIATYLLSIVGGNEYIKVIIGE